MLFRDFIFAARALRKVCRSTAARDGRTEQHGAPDARVRAALQVAQHDDPAQAVADQVQARRLESGNSLGHAGKMLRERASHGAIAQGLHRETFPLQRQSEIAHDPAVHPRPVQQQHGVFGRCAHRGVRALR